MMSTDESKVWLVGGGTTAALGHFFTDPKGPKWLKHLLRRCFGVVLRLSRTFSGGVEGPLG